MGASDRREEQQLRGTVDDTESLVFFLSNRNARSVTGVPSGGRAEKVSKTTRRRYLRDVEVSSVPVSHHIFASFTAHCFNTLKDTRLPMGCHYVTERASIGFCR